MNNVGNSIIELFSNVFNLIEEKETCDEYVVECQINGIKIPSTETDVTSKINQRDQIAIYFFESVDAESVDYISTKQKCWEAFSDELQTKNIQYGRLKIQISKSLKDNRLSIYNINKFTEYINSLSLSQFISVIDARLVTFLVFEIQDENYSSWSTNTIFFLPKDTTISMSGFENIDRIKRINDARKLCYCESEKNNVIPEDLFIAQYDENESLQKAFTKTCMVYLFIFIFDYSSIKNDIYEYKLNGFKTLNGQKDTQKISRINVDANSCKSVYEIYQWLYLGGSNSDKINIARNIISLNIDKEYLSLDASAFASILSNYKIYEKENVKQYLQVRNKLSELLIELQGKISTIVDAFINDFKKNIITLLSFFISVIVIRVISKGDFVGGFTNEIVGLTFVFLIISLGLLFYSRWELTKKMDLYDKHYDQIKNRYKDVLSSIELEDIFKECDPLKDGSNSFFVLKQKKIYSWLWVISVLLLALFLVVVIFINNNIQICCILNKVICCIQNIFQ